MANEKNAMNAVSNDVPNFANWEELQTGFAPYWNPEPNSWIFAQIAEKDERQEDFTRYLLRAGVDTKCKRGPADNAEDVIVKKGEYFTISVYFALQGLFDLFLETGLSPWLRIESVAKVKTKTPGQTTWTWKIMCSPEDRKKIEAKKEQLRMMSDAGDPKELPASAAS